MATDINVTRQTVLYAERDFTYDDFVSGEAKEMIYLQAGSKVLRGGVDITTAFNSGTSDTLTVGDTEGTTPDVDRYVASIDGQAEAVTLFNGVTDGLINTSEAITMTNTQVVGSGEAATAGAGKLWIEYVVDNRVTELHAYRG